MYAEVPKVSTVVTVVRMIEQTARVSMLVDENEDQWTTFEKAAKIADDRGSWNNGASYLSRTRSDVRVIVEVRVIE